MDYIIRKIKPEEVSAALDMVLEVFMEFEAPEYPPEGVATFRRDVMENETFIKDCKAGICPFYGAFDGEKIIGVIGMRKSRTHINLLFVRKEYHRMGIASAMFRRLLTERLRENPELPEITVNSSPYGRDFYLRVGFMPLSDELQTNGIRYIPMKYTVNKNDIPAPCGAVCAQCERYPASCAGCREIRGRVWWLEYTGQPVCAFRQCCVEKHGYAHCGKCGDFPCELFRHGDPTRSDAENAEILKKQILALKGENDAL